MSKYQDRKWSKLMESEIKKQRASGNPVSPGLLASYEKHQQEIRNPAHRQQANNRPGLYADKLEWNRWHKSKRAALSVQFGGFDEDVMEMIYQLSFDQLNTLELKIFDIEHYQH